MSSINGIENAKKRDAIKVKLICENCGNEYEITYGRYRRIKNASYKKLCKKCFPKLWYVNMSEESKIKHNQGISNAWKNKSEEDKESIKQKHRDAWNNKTKEEKIKHSLISSENLKKYWSELSEEEKERRRIESSIILQEYRETMTDIERININKKISNSSKSYWGNITNEELNYHKNNTSKYMLEWWRNASKEQLEERSLKLSIKALEWWKNLTPDKYQEWNKKRMEGLNKYLSNLENYPTKTEKEFMNLLHMNSISYEWHWYTTIKYSDFDKLFPYNLISKNPYVSPYHEWDFKLNFINKSILVDIDGSIHDSNKTNYNITCWNGTKVKLSEYIKFNDSKRPYQTDGLESYVVQCYNDTIDYNSNVLDIKTNNIISMKQFILIVNELNILSKNKIS